MKKLLGSLVLVLLWCSAGFADKSFDPLEVKKNLKKMLKSLNIMQLKKWQHDPEGRKLIALML